MSIELKVVGIAGGAGTGKDWIVTNVLQPLGFRGIAFADHFKIELVGLGLYTFEEVFETKPPHVRNVLQIRGTELGRKITHDDVWIDTMFADMRRLAWRWGPDFTRYVVTDCRYENEIRAVQKNGGVVYRVNAPTRYAANKLTPEQRQHTSELLVASDKYNHLFDGIIDNDPDVQDTTVARFTAMLEANGVIPRKGTGHLNVHAGMKL